MLLFTQVSQEADNKEVNLYGVFNGLFELFHSSDMMT